MNIHALGTGAADSIEYYHSCFFFNDSQESSFLVDGGGGARIFKQLKDSNINLSQIHTVFLTHKHLDHVLGVIWLFRRIGSKVSKGKLDSFIVYAPSTVCKFLNEVLPGVLKERIINEFGGKIRIVPLKNNQDFFIGQNKITPFDIKSKKEEQYGFVCLTSQGKKIVFLGDEPLPLHYDTHDIRNCDLLFADAYCLTKDKEKFNPSKMSHSTVQEAATFANKINAKSLVLHHTEEKNTFSNRKELYIQDAQNYYNGSVHVPNDLDIVSI